LVEAEVRTVLYLLFCIHAKNNFHSLLILTVSS
jgi:hypothetical protein